MRKHPKVLTHPCPPERYSAMAFENEGARRYFDSIPDQWDAIYAHEHWLRYLINRVFRADIFERYNFTFAQCGDVKDTTILDIGCGSGRVSIECAKRGARRVVGIDFAPAMIDYSHYMAEHFNVGRLCEFICNDFVSYPFDEQFDIIVALGVFDYVKHPDIFFRKIALLNPRIFIASFPKFTSIWGLQRHIHYHWIRHCPIYNYTRDQLDRLCRDAGFADYTIVERTHAFLLRIGTPLNG